MSLIIPEVRVPSGDSHGHDYKAVGDMTRCLACRYKFSPDDIRSNVYNDTACIGAIHEDCYPFLGGPPERAPNKYAPSSPTNVSRNRTPGVVGVAD